MSKLNSSSKQSFLSNPDTHSNIFEEENKTNKVIYVKILDTILENFLGKKIKKLTHLTILNKITKQNIKEHKEEEKDFIFSLKTDSIFNNDTNETNFFVFPSPLIDRVCLVISHYFAKHFKEQSFSDLNLFFQSLNLIPEDNNSKISLQYSDKCDFTIINLNDIKSKDKKNKHKRENEKIVIEDFEFLKEYYFNIKKIQFLLPNFEVLRGVYLNYLIILFNSNWLFNNLIEFEVNITNFQMFQVGKKKKIKENNFYYLIFSLFYFLGKFYTQRIQKLVLIAPYAYTFEMNKIFSNEIIQNCEKNKRNYIHLFETFDQTFSKLNSLSIEFNSLDNTTFQNINSFLSKNNELSSLNIAFFPLINADLYCTNEHLRKFVLLSKIPISSKIIDINVNEDSEVFSYNTFEYYLDVLFRSYQINFAVLFISIVSIKDYLKNLSIHFDIPDCVSQNERYSECFVNFLKKLFMFIESGINYLLSLEISSETLILNGLKFVKFQEKIDENKMENNTILQTLTLNLRIMNFDNLAFLIPRNVKYLTLGEIDKITCEWLLKDIEMFNNLECLIFAVYDNKRDYNDNFKLLQKILEGKHYPIKLTQIILEIRMNLQSSMLNEIVDKHLIKLNFVQNWELKFNIEKIDFGHKPTTEEIEMFKDTIYKPLNEKRKKGTIQSLQVLGYLKRIAIVKAFYKKGLLIYNNDKNEYYYDNKKILFTMFKFLSYKKARTINLSI